MRSVSAAVIYGIIVSSALAEAPGERPAFIKLQDALAYIDDELDKQDWTGLKNALYPPCESDYYRTSWKYLKDIRGNRRLVNSFPGMKFPSSRGAGGSCSLLFVGDLVHAAYIQFTNTGGKWYLEEIAGAK